MYAADDGWHGDSLRLRRTIGCPYCADAPGNRTVSAKPVLRRITQTATFCYSRESPPSKPLCRATLGPRIASDGICMNVTLAPARLEPASFGSPQRAEAVTRGSR